MCNSNERTSTIRQREQEILPERTLQTTKDFKQCNELIERNVLALKVFERCISQRGGKDVEAATRNVMAFVLTNTLGREYSWCGMKGNRNFQETKISDVIIRAMLQAYPGSKRTIIGDTIKNWLRRTGDRIKSPVSKERRDRERRDRRRT